MKISIYNTNQDESIYRNLVRRCKHLCQQPRELTVEEEEAGAWEAYGKRIAIGSRLMHELLKSLWDVKTDP